MTPDTTAEAIRALTQAVQGLRDSIASQIPWPAWVQALATLVLVVVTWAYVRHTGRMATHATQSAEAARDLVRLEGEKLALAREQEEREREREKRLLAGALADELGGLLTRWEEMVPPDEERPQMFGLSWSSEESYFTIYESVGSRLRLLPEEVAREVAVCYMKAKVTLDNMRVATRLTDWSRERDPDDLADAVSRAMYGAMLSSTKHAFDYGDQTAERVRALIPKLDAIADPKQARGQPT